MRGTVSRGDDVPLQAPLRSVTVLRAGALTTVQDAGRPGWAHLGVPHSGFLDRASARWANRLAGNPEETALLESTASGLSLLARAPMRVAVTGARADVRLGARLVGQDEAHEVATGDVIRVGPAMSGVRTYVALDGGVAVAPVLGSRSTDLLGGIGPAVLRDGDVLGLGEPFGARPSRTHGVVPRSVEGARPRPEVWTLRVVPGPRSDWLDDVAVLDGVEFVVGAGSNRVGLRLEQSSRVLSRRLGELLSEPAVLGAVQLPPSGDPVVFLADHPTTGGYPVVAVVVDADLDLCARMRPGDRVRWSLRR